MLPAGVAFEPLMTLYLTDNTPPDEIRRAQEAGVVALKLYPAGATTNSDAGVTDIRKTTATLEAMQREGLLLLVHGEVTDGEIDVFDREAVFIDRVMQPLRRDFPELKVVFEHITTAGRSPVRRGGRPADTAATITAHHLLYNRNALVCRRPASALVLPAGAQEASVHRQALVEAAVSGSSRSSFSAPTARRTRHRPEGAERSAEPAASRHRRRSSCTPKPSRPPVHWPSLEAFASHHGPDFYGLAAQHRPP